MKIKNGLQLHMLCLIPDKCLDVLRCAFNEKNPLCLEDYIIFRSQICFQDPNLKSLHVILHD